MPETLKRLNEVLRAVFDDDGLTATRQTTARDVPNRDSLMHVNLIVNVERTFGIRFTSSEVAGLKNVGELADFVDAKLAAKQPA